MCSGSKEGSNLRLIDFVSLNSRLESNKEEEEGSRQIGHTRYTDTERAKHRASVVFPAWKPEEGGGER